MKGVVAFASAASIIAITACGDSPPPCACGAFDGEARDGDGSIADASEAVLDAAVVEPCVLSLGTLPVWTFAPDRRLAIAARHDRFVVAHARTSTAHGRDVIEIERAFLDDIVDPPITLVPAAGATTSIDGLDIVRTASGYALALIENVPSEAGSRLSRVRVLALDENAIASEEAWSEPPLFETARRLDDVFIEPSDTGNLSVAWSSSSSEGVPSEAWVASRSAGASSFDTVHVTAKRIAALSGLGTQLQRGDDGVAVLVLGDVSRPLAFISSDAPSAGVAQDASSGLVFFRRSTSTSAATYGGFGVAAPPGGAALGAVFSMSPSGFDVHAMEATTFRGGFAVAYEGSDGVSHDAYAEVAFVSGSRVFGDRVRLPGRSEGLVRVTETPAGELVVAVRHAEPSSLRTYVIGCGGQP